MKRCDKGTRHERNGSRRGKTDGEPRESYARQGCPLPGTLHLGAGFLSPLSASRHSTLSTLTPLPPVMVTDDGGLLRSLKDSSLRYFLRSSVPSVSPRPSFRYSRPSVIPSVRSRFLRPSSSGARPPFGRRRVW